jgi:transcriptional regulator with XRE-family HTH domain
MTPFGKWLKRQRKDHKKTQQELAEVLGVSQATLSKIEQGVEPSAGVALKAAQLFHLTQDELFKLYKRSFLTKREMK